MALTSSFTSPPPIVASTDSISDTEILKRWNAIQGDECRCDRDYGNLVQTVINSGGTTRHMAEIVLVSQAYLVQLRIYRGFLDSLIAAAIKKLDSWFCEWRFRAWWRLSTFHGGAGRHPPGRYKWIAEQLEANNWELLVAPFEKIEWKNNGSTSVKGPKPPRKPPPMIEKIVELMEDGKKRTYHEIAKKVATTHKQVADSVRRIKQEALGSAIITSTEPWKGDTRCTIRKVSDETVERLKGVKIINTKRIVLALCKEGDRLTTAPTTRYQPDKVRGLFRQIAAALHSIG